MAAVGSEIPVNGIRATGGNTLLFVLPQLATGRIEDVDFHGDFRTSPVVGNEEGGMRGGRVVGAAHTLQAGLQLTAHVEGEVY